VIAPDPVITAAVMQEIECALETLTRRPVVIGICGAQGSGKSTLAFSLQKECTARGLVTAVLSLDDLYLTRAKREELAREVHPLLLTRGPPATHDTELGLRTFALLDEGAETLLPRFDKARDDRAPVEHWMRASAHCDVLLFEGWCVGAAAEPDDRLHEPVNALEAEEDKDALWRRHVNRSLGGEYQALFARIDRLVLLAAPGFEAVFAWRQQQERDLRARMTADQRGVMDDAALVRFIAHYERLTRWILEEMPGRADLVIRLDQQRRAIMPV
jgi:D-glycerate 3-kinase